ncbi:MAG: hypothetical protein KAH38_04845, partial [Candidatus Hydrogenedentes bacterium]|nr:hypothetical protein [Candidatus Hydrogenedentota bacterium]
MGVIFVIFFAAVFPCVAAESSAQTISAEMWQHSSIEEEQKGGVNYSSSKEFDGEEDTVILDVAAGSPVVFYQYFLDLPRPEVNTLYTFSVRIKTEFVSDGVGAFASLGMRTDPDGPRVIASDTERVTGTKDWQQVSAALFIPEQCAGLQLLLLLHGTGKAWFAAPTLTLVESFVDASESNVSIAVHDSPVIENFIGFGLEDDCYFFTDENFRHGIDAADIALRESRIEELDPKVIATLFWWDAISPSHNLDTVTYDTELMRALYTTLEPHQQSGRSVLFSDSHWGWTTDQFPYSEKNFEKGVDVYVKLFEHLIHEKGFDCIRYVSISGEVDMVFEQLGGTFESYVQSVNLFRRKLDAAGLEQVQIIGDKTGGLLWFRNAVAAVGETMDLFAVHEYPDVTQYAVLPYRLGSALETVRTYAPKPAGITDSRWPQAFVWEIGYRDQSAGDTDNSATAVHDFSYGLLCAYTCITAMNQGYSGGSVWCLHSMYYPG